MYFPVGWPKRLRNTDEGSPLVHIASSADRLLYSVLAQRTLSIWFCKPSVEIVSHRRSERSLTEFGTNKFSKWRPDSSKIAVATSEGYVLFYKVEIDKTIPSQTLFNQHEDRNSMMQLDEFDYQYVHCVPALTLTQLSYIQVPGGCTGMVCLRDDLLISSGRGLLQRLHWTDMIVNPDMTVELASVPFSTDLQQSRSSQLGSPNVFLVCLHFSPLLGGFAAVFSNGRAAFITANTLKFEPEQVVGVWAQEITEATTCAVNHKYAVMAFGCESGEGVVYHIDEMTGALAISHRLTISCKDFPDAGQICGAVSELKWTSDGATLVMSWKKGGFSLWSVFGSLLLHSMGVESGACLSSSSSRPSLLRIKSMEWGCESYHLWMISDRPKTSAKENTASKESDQTSSSSDEASPCLLKLNFVKSSLTVNPCMSNHEHLVLQGEDRLYLNPEDGLAQAANPSIMQPGSNNPSAFVGNKQWHIVPLPHTYISHNWPLKYAAMSPAGHCVAVTGKSGMAHYSLISRKWKLFGNETQERDMMVTGGLTWWKDFICCACYNLLDQKSELRLYHKDNKLDNTFAHIVSTTSQILQLNTFRDVIVILTADCHIVFYKAERKPVQQSSSIVIHKLQEIPIGSFIPHPSNVVALCLTSLRTDSGTSAKVPVNSKEIESILLNVAGRLLMFQRDRSASLGKAMETKDGKLIFTTPVIVASAVESLWLYTHSNTVKPHLTEVLWLGCGSFGIKVWLPLQPKDESSGRNKGFLSRRIMLPFNADIYPLGCYDVMCDAAMLFEAGIILGANSEAVSYPVLDESDVHWPHLQLERTSQVYLHHILRQLLRRNLGGHALEVARSCTDLPYFPHVLELLVHEVLEEEATSKDPIPDALLPRVVAFVEEFPEYLQTIAHCARKSDVTVWNYFFSVVGNPIDLFQECLMAKKLEVAASYLIILQNLEKPLMARQHATMLLDSALENCSWDLTRDLVRFLSAIVPSSSEPAPSGKRHRQNSTSIYPVIYPSSPLSMEGSDDFVYPSAVVRGRSVGKDDVPIQTKDSVKVKDKSKTYIRSDSFRDAVPNKSRHSSELSKDYESPDKINVEAILNRHAHRLLSAYRLYDLACFAANMEDYQLVQWLRKERLLSAKVDNFMSALKKIHEDFHWPLPMLSLNAMRRLSSVTSLDSHSNSAESPENKKFYRTDSHSFSSVGDATVLSEIPGNTAENGSIEGTDMSESGSLHCEADSNDSWGDAQTLKELELVSVELINKGPPQAQVQLRYLFHILVEAGCLEWASLVSIVLRDSMCLLRVVNLACLSGTAPEIVLRCQKGLADFELWVNTDCPGYKPFLQLISGHVTLLQKIEVNLPQPSRHTSLVKSASSESGNLYELNEQKRNSTDDSQLFDTNTSGVPVGADPVVSESKEQETDSSSCVVS